MGPTGSRSVCTVPAHSEREREREEYLLWVREAGMRQSGENFQVRWAQPRGAEHAFGPPDVFWTIQIYLGLRGCFSNFILKNYLNRSGPSETHLDD